MKRDAAMITLRLIFMIAAKCSQETSSVIKILFYLFFTRKVAEDFIDFKEKCACHQKESGRRGSGS